MCPGAHRKPALHLCPPTLESLDSLGFRQEGEPKRAVSDRIHFLRGSSLVGEMKNASALRATEQRFIADTRRIPSLALDNARITVVMPVYNERQYIEEIIRRVQESGIVSELIIVDDGSTDGTREWLLSMAALQANGQQEAEILEGSARLWFRNVRFLFQTKNCGKGAALQWAFAVATGDVVIVQDADLEYDPRDYGKLLEPILDGRADVVYGSRFLGGPQRVHYFWHYVANRILTLLSDMLTNLKLTDIETCYKVLRREVLEGIQLKSNRFGFEPEITAKVAKGKWRVYEVPISYSGRTYEEGKKITWRDGVHTLWCILRYRILD